MANKTSFRPRKALSYAFQFELPYVGIHEARNRLWMRLIHKYGQEAVLRHRTALHTAVVNIHNAHVKALAKKEMEDAS